MIRFTRRGKKHAPVFRLVVAESRKAVKKKFIEILGFYNPLSKESKINKEKVIAWLNKGAKPSNRVAKLLKEKKIIHQLIIVKKVVKKPKNKEKEKELKKTKSSESPVKAEAGLSAEASAKAGRPAEKVIVDQLQAEKPKNE